MSILMARAVMTITASALTPTTAWQRTFTIEDLGVPWRRRARGPTMKWVTREKARVDRIACPWLIARFIDPAPEFLFVPDAEVEAVAKREGAVPYDVPNVELGHHGAECSFDAFVARYELDDPALGVLATIVRGADTNARSLT